MSKRKLQHIEELAAADAVDEFDDLDEDDDSDDFEQQPLENTRESLRQFRRFVDKEKKNGKAPTADAAQDKGFLNKQRVLVLSSRGTSSRYRHLMLDLRKLLPHHKKDVKMDAKDALDVINEIAELKSCNNCIYFDTKKKTDCYLWFSKTPNGPSAKFHLTNVHTLGELKLFGNCLMGSRPVLTFDSTFDSAAHWQLLKEMFTQIFGTPRGHPKSKPFVDHMMSFFIVDNRIWFRHYQIVDKDEGPKKNPPELVEIGPRFVLNPIRIFSGSFGGPTLYHNANFVPPAQFRANIHLRKADRYMNRVQKQQDWKDRKQHNKPRPGPNLDAVFDE